MDLSLPYPVAHSGEYKWLDSRILNNRKNLGLANITLFSFTRAAWHLSLLKDRINFPPWLVSLITVSFLLRQRRRCVVSALVKLLWLLLLPVSWCWDESGIKSSAGLATTTRQLNSNIWYKKPCIYFHGTMNRPFPRVRRSRSVQTAAHWSISVTKIRCN